MIYYFNLKLYFISTEKYNFLISLHIFVADVSYSKD